MEKMRILVLAPDESWEELVTENPNVDWLRAADTGSFISNTDSDAYVNLTANAAEADYSHISRPVIIHAVSITLKELKARKNICRINGWKGFIKRSKWEVAGDMDEKAAAVFSAMQKTVIPVPDEPGFIAGRIISMIINEAYFALGEAVSSKEEIDTAMKLGTNYPYGPFEWANRIGTGNIHELLLKLSVNDKRYQPSPSLVLEATEKI